MKSREKGKREVSGLESCGLQTHGKGGNQKEKGFWQSLGSLGLKRLPVGKNKMVEKEKGRKR